MDATAMSVEEDLYDVNVTSTLDWHTSALSLGAPREELDRGVRLMEDVLRHPAFPKAELKRYQKEIKDNVLYQQTNDPGSLMRSAMASTWYAPGAPYDPRPDLRAVQRVRVADLFARHAELLATAPVRLYIAGDLSLEEAKAAIAPLTAGVGVAGAWSENIPEAARSGEALVAVDLPGATQVTIGLRAAAPRWGAEDTFAFEQASYALVGPFLSRLNKNLREEKGWTYGVGGGYRADIHEGVWTLRGVYSPEYTEGVIREIRAEIDTISEGGARPDEIGANWRETVATWNDAFLDAPSALSLYTEAGYHGTTVEALRARLTSLGAARPEATAEAARAWLSPAHGRVWVVVGDRAKIEAALTASGLPVTWVTREQAVFGTFPAPLPPAAP
jgi:predicted Zn-dependent peptidase